MRAIIQRVSAASVTIGERVHSAISAGLLVFIGVEEEDNEDDCEYLASKIASLRIFSDENGKMNLDIKQVNGSLLIVSQFTLHASTKKGNRPSFIRAAGPEKATDLYEKFIHRCETLAGVSCRSGVFGADMKVKLVNDGPVTIYIDSRQKE
jgi:D-aminoacyl-tRNA deacylase